MEPGSWIPGRVGSESKTVVCVPGKYGFVSSEDA